MKKLQVNDYVVQGNLGICQVRDIRRARFGGAEPVCYVLKRLADPASTVYIPTDSADLSTRFRPVLTRAEVLALIEGTDTAGIPGTGDERERSRDLQARIQSGNCRELIRVIRVLHQERSRQRKRGRNLNATDARLLAQAERMLHDEFALALGIEPEAVVPFILEHLPHGEETAGPTLDQAAAG